LFIMKRMLVPGAVVAAAALAVAGCGGASSSSPTSSAPAAMPSAPAPAPSSAAAARVALADHGLGQMLVDGDGRTLYLFKADKTTESTCSGACAQVWPPVTDAAKVKAGAGIDAHLIGDSRRADGTSQVTYAGHPLYLYAGDGAAGGLLGQGLDSFGALWWAVAPSGTAITRLAG
jgi:predicted lipoprotein with Yx(FWY)xxD motif